MSGNEEVHEPIRAVSTTLRYQAPCGYPSALDPTELSRIIRKVQDLIDVGMPGTAIHGISFVKGQLEVEVR